MPVPCKADPIEPSGWWPMASAGTVSSIMPESDKLDSEAAVNTESEASKGSVGVSVVVSELHPDSIFEGGEARMESLS